MSPETYVICSFGLTFGIPMAMAVREYWTLGASPGHLPPGEPAMPEPQPLPDAGAGTQYKPLPACLIPAPLVTQSSPARERELA